MNTKKILSAVLSAALSMSLFSACTGRNEDTSQQNSGGASSGNVTLTVWGSQEDQALLKRMCEEFAAQSTDKKYSFVYGVVSEADAKKEVLKDISAAADVFGFASDQTAELVSAGALYRITKDRDKISADNTVASVNAATVNDELYGYPYVSDTYFMYYDSSKFTEDEVKELEKMLAKDIEGVKTNFAFDTDNGWYQAAFFFGAGCKLFGEDGTDPTKCDFNSDRGILAGEYLIDLVKNSKYGVNFDDGMVKAGFADGTGTNAGANLSVLFGEVTNGNAGNTACTDGANEVGRHQGDGFAGIWVIEHNHQYGARETAFGVNNIGAVPLHAGDVEAAAHVCGHRHKAAIWAVKRHVGEFAFLRELNGDTMRIVVIATHDVIARA